MLKAVTRSAGTVDQHVAAINRERASRGQSKISVAYYFDHYGTDADTDVTVMEEDFLRAKEELTPSVSMDELRHYERVRSTFEGATKRPASSGDTNPSRPASAGTKETNGASNARSKALDAMKRVNKSKSPSTNGDYSSPPFRPIASTPVGGLDDDYVIRTDQLSLNEGRPPSSKGKGKGKSRQSAETTDGDFKPAAYEGVDPSNGMRNGNGEEDLYD